MPDISIILCTYNPSLPLLSQTLKALELQTLSKDRWELVIVDNNSSPPLTAISLEPLPPQTTCLRETKKGKNYALMQAFGVAKADLMVIVDDDNFLSPDYLETCLRLSVEWPILGAWGGQCIPQFEVTPPEWTRPYWTWLAIKTVERDRWSSSALDSDSTPCGAGMCVRRSVVDAYLAKVKRDPRRAALGTAGRGCGGEDTDLCLTSADIGLGTGTFRDLRLTHVIPKRRLDESYLLNFVEEATYTSLLLNHFQGLHVSGPSLSQRILKAYQLWHLPQRERRFEGAKLRGRVKALREIQILTRDSHFTNTDQDV